MRIPIAIETADLHLEDYAWKNHRTLAGDAYYGLQQITELALDNKVKGVSLLGDVFNVKNPDPRSVAVAFNACEILHKAGIKILYTQGQHELSRNTPWMSVHKWPTNANQMCIEFTPDMIAYGLDWTHPSKVKAELAAIPKCAGLLLCHQVWGDFHGSMIEHECNFSDVPGHVRMLITGDYHKHFTLQAKNGAGRAMTVGSPGSVCLQSINEDPKKACFILYDDWSLVSVPLKSRKLFHFVINDRHDLDDLLSTSNWARQVACVPQQDVPSNIAKNIVRVSYQENIPDAYVRLFAAFNNDTHLFATPMRVKRDIIEIEASARQSDTGRGLRGALSLTLPAGQFLADAVRLLDSTTPEEEYDKLQKEFIDDKERQTASRG